MAKITAFVVFLSLVLGSALVKSEWVNNRIVGGFTVQIDDFPYQVSLQNYGSHICGGSIISSNFILTACHCTFGKIASNLRIRAASSYHFFGGQTHQVAQIIQHPNYDNINVDYDFALLKLKTSIVFTSKAKPIALPSANEALVPGTPVVVSGWGATQSASESSLKLRAVLVPIIDQNECSETYKEISNITERMFCAGHVQNGGKDSCQGDSGGPLMVNEILYGVVSWGYRCAQPKYPGVYAKISNVRQWIKTNSNI